MLAPSFLLVLGNSLDLYVRNALFAGGGTAFFRQS